MAKKTNTKRPIHPKLKLAGTKPAKELKRWDVTRVWSKKLGKPFTPVSSYFLDNYHRLPNKITHGEFVLIVHLLKYKWDEAMPFPAIATLAKKMEKSDQAVRATARTLENKGYLKRNMIRGRPNHYDLEPLFRAIEKLYDADEAAKTKKRSAKSHQTG